MGPGGRHAIYGDLVSRESIALVAALAAKGIDFDFVGESPALSLALATRSGHETGPYLRTPEGVVLGGLRCMLDYLDRVHPEPAWRPTTPLRSVVSRILEDWIELWLPLWPERAGAVVEGLAVHLEHSPFLLGRHPCRADGSLAGWLEAEILTDGALRAHVERRAPRLLGYAGMLRDAIHASHGTWTTQRLLIRPARIEDDPDERESWLESIRRPTAVEARADDALPFSLLDLLSEIALDFHAYLAVNCEALAAGEDRVELELGDGATMLPTWPACEERRAAIGDALAQLAAGERRAVRQMLEPLGAWRVFALPPAVEAIALADPRGL